MFEYLAELFYNPWIFWGVPVIIALVLEVIERWRTYARARHNGS